MVNPRGYVCYRAERPILIDGKVDEAAWANAPWSEDFVDIEGDAKPKPRFKTRMKMLWDDQAIYIAAEMEEPHLWATLKEHDSVIFRDHDFEVFLDPDGDHQNYCELELNALNTTWDLLLTKPYIASGLAVNAWEIQGLKTAVHHNGTLNDSRDKDKGWSVEIAWPFEGLRELNNSNVPPREGDQWRINFSRVEWDMEIAKGVYKKIPKRSEHNWVWSPQGLIDMHRPWQWGYVQFSNKEPGSVTVRPDKARAVQQSLVKVFEAQRHFRATTKEFADSLVPLKIDPDTMPLGFRLEKTANAFEAVVPVPGSPGFSWVINQDCWLRKVGPATKK